MIKENDFLQPISSPAHINQNLTQVHHVSETLCNL
jgi:hypothetical protein